LVFSNREAQTDKLCFLGFWINEEVDCGTSTGSV